MLNREYLCSWKNLQTHAREMKAQHMREFFALDKNRFNKFKVELPSLLLDYSKNQITEETMGELFSLARECKLEESREKMLSGEAINVTENRAVLHTALRKNENKPFLVGGKDISASISKTLHKVQSYSEKIRQRKWLGFSGKPVKDVVSIGIGGSNLGPLMVTEALKPFKHSDINVHYVSNVDGTQIANTLDVLNPETTLFIISSKTFTTSETMTNAKTAIKWLEDAAGNKEANANHFLAVSTNIELVTSLGILEENIFEMWDWVGGRFSLWSAIGLPIAIALGFEQFQALLEGAKEMDEHFCKAPLEENVPVILALISVWNCTFLGAQSQALLPYDQCLHKLSAYMQQAEMESNGKSVDISGKKVKYSTVPVIWGELGINGQHAFYQYLHQSNNIVPADFIGSINCVTSVDGHHDILMSNFFAQTQALMLGVSEDKVRQELINKGVPEELVNLVAPHKVHEGNRPTNSILMKRLDAKTLGSLIAMYEHKIFTQGIVLHINSFDQWGVELGKGLASQVHKDLTTYSTEELYDSSTSGLINYYKTNKTVD